MSPRLRRIALTVHVTMSVGWIGAVAAFLALAVCVLVSDDAGLVRGAYLSMEVLGWFVLMPLALASLLSGVAQSLGTNWGLLRHYWVVFKLGINVFATLVLLAYMQTLDHFADLAASGAPGVERGLASASPLLHAAAALLLLLVATVLAVFKPRGLTPLGRAAAGQSASRRL